MAREEHDREDMLAEAKNLVERASLRLPDYDEEVFVGFRREGGASFYFGPLRAYHLTSIGQLRRAFVGGLLYKAEEERLVSLRRQRTECAVELLRHELSDTEQRMFLDEMQRHLNTLRDALASGNFAVVGQVPRGADVVERTGDWFERFAGKVVVARSPHAG